MKVNEARAVIKKFKVLVNCISLSDKILNLALSDTNFKDFEDGIQYYSALEANCQLIISRNGKGFKNSSIPVMRPNEYFSYQQ